MEFSIKGTGKSLGAAISFVLQRLHANVFRQQIPTPLAEKTMPWSPKSFRQPQLKPSSMNCPRCFPFSQSY